MSVIIPIFNRANSVADVVACLHRQSFMHWEAIFIDDGSEVDLLAAITPFLDDKRIRYVRLERNWGVSTARNCGVRESHGRYVAFLDSDDHWHPNKLSRQVALMAQLPLETRSYCVTLTAVMMPGGWQRVRPNFPPQQGRSFGHYLYVQGGFAQISSLLLSRDLALTNPFHEGLRQYEDHLLFIQLHASGANYIVIPDVLAVWRNDIRADRLSRRDDIERGEEFLRVASELLDPAVQCAFRLRALGGVLIRHRPRQVAELILFGLRQRALPPRQIGAILARHILPPRLWQRIVRPAR